MATFDRGFKSWAERTSGNIRRELDLSPHDPLDVFKLADYLSVTACTPRDFPGLPEDILHQLLVEDPWGWSAATLALHDERTLLIYNPRKSAGRRASDIGHELAHVLIEHKPSTIIFSHDGSFAMRTFDQKQEDEANWLAWSLLLPREALLRAQQNGLSTDQIADLYGVTSQLVEFRLRMTGVSAQLARSKGRFRR